MAGGVDWVSLASLLATLGFGVFGVIGVIYTGLPYVQNQLHEDEEYRQETARRLRGVSLGGRYRDSLRGALARLDRWFGEPGSARALGVCIWVAVAYAYASYFIGWGLGGAGNIGGFKMLPDDATQPGRGIVALIFVLLPVAVFYLCRSVARWANRWERRFKAWMLQRWRRGFVLAYRVLLGLVVFLLLYYSQTVGGIGKDIFVVYFFTALLVVGILAGYYSARYIKSGFFAIVVAVIVGAMIIDGLLTVILVRGSVGFVVIALTLVGFAAIAITLLGTGAAAVVGTLVASVIAEISFKAVTVTGAVTEAIVAATTFVIINTGALGVAAGVLHPQSHRRGLLWVGGFGAFVGLGIMSDAIAEKQAASETALFILLFFLILPLANGLFDWLSWWATRALGRRLLGLLAKETSGWQRGWAIAGFGLADLAIAVGLLLAMAYTLALGFEGYNEFAQFQRHEAVFALRTMIEAAAASPWHSGFWLTAMLLTTLLPTFGHGLVLLGSPLGVVFIPDRQRLALAEALDGYEQMDKSKQAALRRRAAGWIIHGRVLSQLAALALLVWLLGRIAAFVYLLNEGGLAAFVAQAAYAGIRTAEGLGGVLLGN